MKEIALDYLCKNKVLHIDMIEGIHRALADVLFASETGVLLFAPESKIFHMSATDEATAQSIIDIIKEQEFVYLLTHQKFYQEALSVICDMESSLVVHQTMYNKTKPLPITNQDIRMRLLGSAHLDFIYSNYEKNTDREYVQTLLNANVVWGAFLDEFLVGFIGIHNEGSIGLLQVLPGFRNQHIGNTLMAFLTNQFLDNGLIPFSQIVLGNKVSLEMQKKLGFEICKDKLIWLLPAKKDQQSAPISEQESETEK